MNQAEVKNAQDRRGCPNCGEISFTKVAFEGISVKFQHDRKCVSCGSVYTPPTPLWARIIFLLLGIGILYVPFHFDQLLSDLISDQKKDFLASITKYFILAVPLSLGCFYCAFGDLFRRK